MFLEEAYSILIITFLFYHAIHLMDLIVLYKQIINTTTARTILMKMFKLPSLECHKIIKVILLHLNQSCFHLHPAHLYRTLKLFFSGLHFLI